MATVEGWTIRRYRPPDRERIRELTVEGFAGFAVEERIDQRWPGVGEMDWRERKGSEVLAEVDRFPEGCFVAEADGEVVGYVTTSVHEGRRQGRIPNLAVDARLRGRGIGRALIETALADFRRRGLRVARIETLENNEVGRHLYPALGFQEIARQIHYAMPLDPAEDQG